MTFRSFAGLATALTAIGLLIFGLVPSMRRDLPHENGPPEWAAALLFLAAAIVGRRRLRDAGVRWRDWRWIIPVSSLLAALDELNWVVFAVRALRRPTVLGMRVDGLHDGIEFGVMLLRDRAPSWVAVVLGVAAAGALAYAAPRVPGWWRVVNRSPSWRFFACAVVLGAIAQTVDLLTHRNRLAQLVEELLEMDGALAMLYAAWLLDSDRRHEARRLGVQPPAS